MINTCFKNESALKFKHLQGFLFLPPSGSLVDKKGKIMIPGIYDSVAPLTDDEQTLYEKIEFDLEEYCQDSGVKKLLHGTKASSSFQLLLLD